MIRVNEFGELMRIAELKIHTAIIGKLGSGKTYLLRRAKLKAIYFENPTFTKYEIAKALNSDENKTTHKLLEELKSNNSEYIIVDNLHTITKTKMRLLLELANKYTIIAATEEIPERLNHLFHKIELEPLDFQDSMMLIAELDLSLDKKTAKKIARQARGNPLLAKQAIEYFRATGEIRIFMPRITRKKFATSMVSVAYLFMSLRYVFLIQRKWELYATVSMVAYSMLSIFRYMRSR